MPNHTSPTPLHRRRTPLTDRPLTAFVFQGGGALSATQVGMLRALVGAGVHADLVIGTSAGALNAVAFASNPSLVGVRRLEKLWLRLRRRDVARVEPRLLGRALVGRADGLLSPAPLAGVLAAMVPSVLEHTALPAHVVATDLTSGAPVVLSRGNAVRALLASAAFPGLFPPVDIGGARLIDGGVVADIPVRQAESLGAKVCYVLPAAVSADTDSPMRGPLAMAYRSLGQILDAASQRNVDAAHGTVHVLPTPASSASNLLAFGDTGRLIEDGYALACGWLQARPSLTTEAVPA